MSLSGVNLQDRAIVNFVQDPIIIVSATQKKFHKFNCLEAIITSRPRGAFNTNKIVFLEPAICANWSHHILAHAALQDGPHATPFPFRILPFSRESIPFSSRGKTLIPTHFLSFLSTSRISTKPLCGSKLNCLSGYLKPGTGTVSLAISQEPSTSLFWNLSSMNVSLLFGG